MSTVWPVLMYTMSIPAVAPAPLLMAAGAGDSKPTHSMLVLGICIKLT
jgi:hypothetical protein